MVYLFLFFNSRNYCPNNRGLDHTEQANIGSTSPDCADVIDNDGDGLVDCADPRCRPFTGGQTIPECAENNERTCFNNFDDDQDGLTDILDLGCYIYTTTGEIVLSMEFGGYECESDEVFIRLFITNATENYLGLSNWFRWGLVYDKDIFLSNLRIENSLHRNNEYIPVDSPFAGAAIAFNSFETDDYDVETQARFISRTIARSNNSGKWAFEKPFKAMKPFEKSVLADVYLTFRNPQDINQCIGDLQFIMDDKLNPDFLNSSSLPGDGRYNFFKKDQDSYHTLS